MFSQNPLNNTLVNISDLKQFLTTHMEVLLKHIVMLKDAKNGNVSDSDFSDYLEDVIGITKALSAKEKVNVITDLLNSANKEFKSIKQLLLLMKDEMDVREINGLYIAVKYMVEASCMENKELRQKTTPWDFKAQHAFNLHDVTKFCLKKLTPYNTGAFKSLDKACKIDTKKFIKNVNNKKIVEYDFRTDIDFDIEKLTFEYKSNDSELHKHVFELRLKKIDEANHAALDVIKNFELTDNQVYIIYSLLNEKNRVIGGFVNYIAECQSVIAPTPDQMIKRNFNLALITCDMINLFEILKDEIDFIVSSINEEKQIKQALEAGKSNILAKIVDLNKRLEKVISRIDFVLIKKLSSEDIAAIQVMKQSLESTKNQLEMYKSKWSGNFSEISGRSLSGVKATAELDLLRISMADSEINNAYIEINKISLKSVEITTETSVKVYEDSLDNQDMQIKKEALEYKIKKEEEIIARNEQVAADRAKKKAEKNKSSVSISTSSIFAEKKVEVVVNESLHPLLLNLNHHQIELLRDILDRGRLAKVSYSDVYYLIVNHLGGNIEEIGNGSSHKRIRIGRFYTELSSNRDSVSLSEVTGGFSRPHGGSHNKELLSRFNLDLVASTLLKAGITLEVLMELESKKSLIV